MYGMVCGFQSGRMGAVGSAVTKVARSAGDLAYRGRTSQHRKRLTRLYCVTMHQVGVSKRVTRTSPSPMAVHCCFWRGSTGGLTGATRGWLGTTGPITPPCAPWTAPVPDAFAAGAEAGVQ